MSVRLAPSILSADMAVLAAEVAEIEAAGGSSNLIGIEIRPALERRLVFDLYDGHRLLVENLQLAFQKPPAR